MGTVDALSCSSGQGRCDARDKTGRAEAASAVDALGATVRWTEASMRATRRGSAKALGNAVWDWNQCLAVALRLRCIHQRIRDPDEMVSSDPS